MEIPSNDRLVSHFCLPYPPSSRTSFTSALMFTSPRSRFRTSNHGIGTDTCNPLYRLFHWDDSWSSLPDIQLPLPARSEPDSDEGMISFSFPTALTTCCWARFATRSPNAATIHTPPVRVSTGKNATGCAPAEHKLTDDTNEANQELVEGSGPLADCDGHGLQVILEEDTWNTATMVKRARVVGDRVLSR